MNPADLETVYENLAGQLDAIAQDRRELFLAKLALLLASDLDDVSQVRVRIEEAAANLDI